MSDLADLIRANSSEGGLYLHIVGFKFPEGVSRAAQADLMADCGALYARCGGEEAGILKFSVVPNLDDRKGFTWIELVLFRDREAFLAFHAHPHHREFAERAAEAADVWVSLDTDHLGSWFSNQQRETK